MMNRLLQLAVLVLLVAGCNESKPAAPEKNETIHVSDNPANGDQIDIVGVPVSKLTGKQKIALLRAEAHKRGLRWAITCFDWEKPEKAFWGSAHDKKVPLGAADIEDGATPWWAADGPTQADVAYALYLSIQGQPTVIPVHKSAEKKEHKYCPQQISGD